MAYTKTNWVNTPSTSTPINSGNLNKIENGIEDVDLRLTDEEIYTTATAGSNGDFYVSLKNTTLTNNRVVKIAFPTATNPSSNARLSIDGGTTYKNISNSLASRVQNQRKELVYNGTTFEITNESNCIVVSKATDYTTLSTAEEKLPLDLVSEKTGGKLSLVSNGVLIGAGVTKVKVSSNVMFSTIPAGALGQIHANNIFLNTTKISETGVRPSGTFPSVSNASKMISVKAGDTIFLFVRSAGAAGSIVRGGSTFTNLIVEVVE